MGAIFDIPKLNKRLEELEKETLKQNFWLDKSKAQNINQEISEIRKRIDSFEQLRKEFAETVELIELADSEGDVTEVTNLAKSLNEIEKNINNLELLIFLSEEYDASDCYLSIKPGAGGTESCDWASMLLRMYQRWIEKKGFRYQILDLQQEEHGIKFVTLQVMGRYAYGYLKGEKGVHRLVRISPFDANARRHTSFAAVDVIPVLPENIEIDIREEDLRYEFFRSSGAGGQYVNKTSSAVRITHIPTGIVVSSQAERSQHQNREIALKMLKAKLYKMQKENQQKELAKLKGELKNISFGSQIRSYVFCPYTLVKDLRTGEQTGNIQEVMDGEIDRFINAYLKWHATGEKSRYVSNDDEIEN